VERADGGARRVKVGSQQDSSDRLLTDLEVERTHDPLRSSSKAPEDRGEDIRKR